MSDEIQRLHRSRKERMLAGVCGGLAQYLKVDPTIIRLLFILALLLGGHGALVYLILWVIVPEEPRAPAPVYPNPV